ncbi:MAG: hypothetical protein U0704_08270 [Candidatus Eisenbacteria bacterium]
MKLAPRVWVLAALLALAVAGLKAPGIAGQVGTYVWLGVFPGLAVARLLLPRARNATRWTFGLLVSPLVSALVAWALLRAGQDLATASKLVGIGGWLLFAGGEGRSLGDRDAGEPDAPMTRWAWCAIGAAVLFALLGPAFNPWIRIRSDTWVHGAIVTEIAQHGVPPVDPRFIGMKLNYVWIFHLFVAQLTSFRGQDPFVFMVLFNVTAMGVLVSTVWQLAHELWDSERAARGAVLLLTLGLNAGAWLLWPLRFARALTGDVRGLDEMRRVLANAKWDSTDVLYELQAPFAHMVNFWDKYTLGGPLGGAYLYLLLTFWALARWLRDGQWRWLAVACLAGTGGVLLHSVVALGVIPVTTGAVVLALLLRPRAPWLPAPKPLLAFWAALVAGFAVALPYLVSIATGWSAKKSGMEHHVIQPGFMMPWTVLTACGITATFAAGGVRRALDERRGLAAWLAIWVLGLTALACIVHLPEGNEHKFVWEISAALALLGAPVVLDRLAAWRARLGTPVFAVLFALVALVPPAAFLRGYLLDPMRTQAEALAPRPGEREMYAFVRDSLDRDVALIDRNSRDLLLVRGQRRMIAGTIFNTERAGFPAEELAARRGLTDDLYGGVSYARADFEYLAQSVRDARRLHPVSTVGILYRASDFAPDDRPWERLEAALPGLVTKRYDRDGFRIYLFDLPR